MADDRPQYQHGTGTIGGTTFHWGSGTPGQYWSVPYGDYPVTPDAPTGDWAHRVGAIPIANNVIPDSLLGRNRIGIMIHSGSASSLDALYTQGCFKVAPSEWPAVRAEILKEAKSGPLYLHVQPGGVASFTNTKTLEQASIPTAAAPGPPIAGALANQGPETVGQAAPAAASEGPLDVRQLVYNKLTGAGLQSHQALGAVWSLAGESGAGLNPSSYNPNDPGGSVGIGQWLGPRRSALEAFAKARGTAVTDPNTQADFLVDELTNPKAATYQPGVFAKMQGAQTAADATKVWTSQFERPKVDNSAARIAGGVNVASLDDKGNFVLGKGAPATSAPTAVAAAPAADQPWWRQALGKIADKPKDAQGNPTGAKSPYENIAAAFEKGPERMKALEENQAPEQVKDFTGTAPPARNVSPGLANVQQTWGTTLNSFLQPLQWSRAPPGAPQMAQAGPQGGAAAPVPGVSLNSLQPSAYGVGYGVNPVGYGFG